MSEKRLLTAEELAAIRETQPRTRIMTSDTLCPYDAVSETGSYLQWLRENGIRFMDDGPSDIDRLLAHIDALTERLAAADAVIACHVEHTTSAIAFGLEPGDADRAVTQHWYRMGRAMEPLLRAYNAASEESAWPR